MQVFSLLPYGFAFVAIASQVVKGANGPGGDKNGEASTKTLDVSVRSSNDLVNFSSGQMGKYGQINNFWAKDDKGFNRIVDGEFEIWKSDGEYVKDAHQYIELEVNILNFSTGNSAGANKEEMYYERASGGSWTKIDAIKFNALMTRHHPKVSLDIRSTINTSSVEITDNSNSKGIDKTFVIKPPALVTKVHDGSNAPFFTLDTNTMEQCRQVRVVGPFDRLQCQIKISKANGEIESREFLMHKGVWDNNGDRQSGGADGKGSSAVESAGFKIPDLNATLTNYAKAFGQGAKGEGEPNGSGGISASGDVNATTTAKGHDQHSGASGVYKSVHTFILLCISASLAI